jgi:hypothetical protein
MSNVNLSADAASIVKAHYQKELAITLQRVREIKQVLAELNGLPADVTDSDYIARATESNLSSGSKTVKVRSTSTRKKKRGRKSFWPNFILGRLKATQTPLSYDDMTNHAIAIKNLDIKKFEKIKKTVIASAFNLRSKEHKIDNYAIKGSRTKYMALPEWFEREGILLQEFRDKLK